MRSRRLSSAVLSAALVLALPALGGCAHEEGFFEDAGESVDEAVEEVRDEVDDAT